MEAVLPSTGMAPRQPSPPNFISITKASNFDRQTRPVSGRARPSTLGRTLKKAAPNSSQGRVVIPQTLSVNIPSPVVFTKKGIEDLPQSSPNPPGVGRPSQKSMLSAEPTMESEALVDRASAARTTSRSATPSAPIAHTQEQPKVRAASARAVPRHARGMPAQSIQRPAVNTWTLSLPDFDDIPPNNSRPSSVASDKRPAPMNRPASQGRPNSLFPPGPPAPFQKSVSSQGLLAKSARAGLLNNAKRMIGKDDGDDAGSLLAPISPMGSPPRRPEGENGSPKVRREASAGSACSNETGGKRGVRFGEFQLANYDPDAATASDGALTERTPSHSRQSSAGSARGSLTARPALGAQAPRPDKSISFRSSNPGVGGMTFVELAEMFEKPASDDEAANEDVVITAYPGDRPSDMTLGEILERTSAHSAHAPGLGGVSLAERVAALQKEKEKEKELKEEAGEMPLTPVIQARSQYMSEYLDVHGSESTGRPSVRPLGIPAGSKAEKRSVAGPPSSPLLPWFEEASQKYNIPLERRTSLYNQISTGEVDGWEQPPSRCTSPKDEGWANDEDDDVGEDPFSGLRRSSDTLFQAAEEKSFDHATEILKKKAASAYNRKNWSKNGGAFSKPYLQSQNSLGEKNDGDVKGVTNIEGERPKLAARGEYFSFDRLLNLDAEETKKKLLSENKECKGEEEKSSGPKKLKKKCPSSAAASRKEVSSTLINGPEHVEVVRTAFENEAEYDLLDKQPSSVDVDGKVEMKSVTEMLKEEEEQPICQSLVPLEDVISPPPLIQEVLMDNEKPCSTPRSLAPELNELVAEMDLRSSMTLSFKRSTLSDDATHASDPAQGTVLVTKNGSLETKNQVKVPTTSTGGSDRPTLMIGNGKSRENEPTSARSSKACKNFQSVLATRPQTAATKIRPHTGSTNRRTTTTVK